MKGPAIFFGTAALLALLAAPRLLPWAQEHGQELLGTSAGARPAAAAAPHPAPKAVAKTAAGRAAPPKKAPPAAPAEDDCDSISSCPPGEALVASPSLVSCAGRCTVAQCCHLDAEAAAEVVELADDSAVRKLGGGGGANTTTTVTTATTTYTATATSTATATATTTTTIYTTGTSTDTTSVTGTTTNGTTTTATTTTTTYAAGTSTVTSTTDTMFVADNVTSTTATTTTTTYTTSTATTSTGTGSTETTTVTGETSTETSTATTTATTSITAGSSGTTATDTTSTATSAGELATSVTTTTTAGVVTATATATATSTTTGAAAQTSTTTAASTATTTTPPPAGATTTLTQAATTTSATTATLTVPAGAGSIAVQGTWTLEVVSGDVASLVASPGMAEAVRLAIAAQVQVDPAAVEVTLSEGSASRRLRGLDAGAPRRLQGTMVASYVIVYPADQQGISDANAAADVFSAATEAQLTSALQSAIESVPDLVGDAFTLVVLSFDAPALVLLDVPFNVSTTDPTGASEALPRAAPLGVAAQLAVAVAVLAASKSMV